MPRLPAWLPPERRNQLLIVLLAIGALAFPLLHDNDADIDSAANAAAYATLALGLNIVVGFAGLLDLYGLHACGSSPSARISCGCSSHRFR